MKGAQRRVREAIRTPKMRVSLKFAPYVPPLLDPSSRVKREPSPSHASTII